MLNHCVVCETIIRLYINDTVKKFIFYLAHYLILYNKKEPCSFLPPLCRIIFITTWQKFLEPVGKERIFQWGKVEIAPILINLLLLHIDVISLCPNISFFLFWKLLSIGCICTKLSQSASEHTCPHTLLIFSLSDPQW